jgi:oligopeptidase A
VCDGDRVLGHCYFDPYLRDDKAYQGGDKGWFVPIRSNSLVGEGKPLGALVMALSPPGYGKPSLLSPSEVVELTRLLGKATQHILAANKWTETSGRLGMEWDALNLVPDFLAHWLSVPRILTGLSSHWSSGERLSSDQVSAIISSGNHLAGYDLCNELYKAAFDMAFYTEDYEDEQYQDLARRLAPQYLVLNQEKEDVFPLYFEDMISGEWAAAYYCRLWSRMLAADIFSAYLEIGLDNDEQVKKMSKRFKKTFLCSGSARPTAQIFREFRGRDPTPEALLLSLGLKDSIQPKSRVAKN